MAAETSWLGDIGNWFTSGDNLKGFGTLLGAGASLYGGINQAKLGKQMFNLEKSAYDRLVKREDETDENWANGFANSTYGQPLVKLG